MPMMNPSPSDIVELFSFVEVTLIQYATVAGHFPGVTASSVKPKPKKANKAEVPVKSHPRKKLRRMPLHQVRPSQRLKGKHEAHLRPALPKLKPNRLKPRKEAKVEVRLSVESLSRNLRRGNSNASHSSEVPVKRVINASMNIRLTMMDDLFPLAQRFFRNSTRL